MGITDTNNVPDLLFQSFVGITGGDFLLLAILLIAIVAFGLIYARAKASTSIIVIVGLTFVMSFFVSELIFVWWLAIIGSIFVLINGLRKWITGQQ